MNLQDIAKGNVGGAGCNTNQKLQADQTVTILPYSNTAACQNTTPPTPSKQSTGLTVANLITDTCGNIFLNIDNSASGATDQTVSLGGPFDYPNQVDEGKLYSINGFAAAGLKINIQDGPVFPAGSLFFGGIDAAGLALLNRFASLQNALLVSRVFVQRLDQSVSANNNFLNQAFKPFTVNSSENYDLTPSGATIFSSVTSTGSGNFVDAYWDFGFCGGLPVTDTTGATFVIPAGFVGQLGVCIAAVQGNIDYNEGC